MPDFPWDQLKAETLRSICSDLGYSRIHYSKEVMLNLVRVVQELGLEQSFEYERELYEAKREDKSAQPRLETTSSVKRTRGTLVVSDYDTRHKRKRMSDPGPRLRRKSAKALAAISDEPQPKRQRARPSKKKAKAAPKTKASAPPSSTRREIFDGVLLIAPRSKGKGKAEEHHDEEGGDEDAEGDVDMEHEDDDLIPDTQVESSLASSNKENEFAPDELSHTEPSSEDQQIQDEPVRDDSRPAVLGTMMPQQTKPQPETAVLPVGEDVAAGQWTAVTPEVAPLDPGDQGNSMVGTHQDYPPGELTAEDVSNVEEVLRAVAANGL